MSITKCIQVTLQMQSSILYSQLNESRLPTLHMTGLGLKKNYLLTGATQGFLGCFRKIPVSTSYRIAYN